MASLAGYRLNRSMGVLLTTILLFHAGWYMLLPFLAVLLTSRRGLTPSQAGLVLAAHSFTLLTGSLVGGWLADRFGRRLTLVAGIGLRALGIAALGLVAGLPMLLGAAAVAGVGGGLYVPAAKAAIATLAEKGNREQAFSLRGIAANLGVSTGPVLGGLLVGGPMPVLFGASAALHGLLGLAVWGLLGDPGTVRPRETGSWRKMVRDRPFLAFNVVTVLAWALFAQLAISVTLYAKQVLGLEAMIGLLFTASSVTVILFQVPITRHLISRLHPMTAMALGTLGLGAGLGLVAAARSFPGLLAAVLMFVVGEMFLMPTADSAVSLMARKGAVGRYFGVATFAWGLGEGLGSLTGGALMEYSLATGRLGLPWAVYAAAGAVIGGLYWALRRWNALREQIRQGRTEDQVRQHVRRVQVYRPGQPAPGEGLLLGPDRDGE